MKATISAFTFNSPTRAPRVNGVIFFTIMEFVGLFPGNTLWGRIFFNLSPDTPDFSNSARASSSDLPLAKASV